MKELQTKTEFINRFLKIVYANSHEWPYSSGNCLLVEEKYCQWEATRLFWRFYWVTSVKRF